MQLIEALSVPTSLSLTRSSTLPHADNITPVVFTAETNADLQEYALLAPLSTVLRANLVAQSYCTGTEWTEGQLTLLRARQLESLALAGEAIRTEVWPRLLTLVEDEAFLATNLVQAVEQHCTSDDLTPIPLLTPPLVGFLPTRSTRATLEHQLAFSLLDLVLLSAYGPPPEVERDPSLTAKQRQAACAEQIRYVSRTLFLC